MKHPYKLPTRFLLLWILNLVLLLAVTFATGFHTTLLEWNGNIRNAAYLYAAVGAVLALLEEWLMDKLRGE